MKANTEQQLPKQLEAAAKIVNRRISEYLENRDDIHPKLKEAVVYAASSPGKRLRAAVIQMVCRLFSGSINQDAITAACSVEMMHAYSLVHDDLPCMDDDQLRRGQPTVHVKFGEASAVLAGDALQSLAFEILAKEIKDSEKAIKLIGILSGFSGAGGMISGQAADMEAENMHSGIEEVEYIHNHKTAMMFAASAAMGAVCGDGKSEDIHNMMQWGIYAGLCFQVVDDLLDESSTPEELGKSTGKDLQQGKATYPAAAGKEESEKRAKALAGKAAEILEIYGQRADNIKSLTQLLYDRKK
ncbi:polyprenyl synthetase family protein [Sedimentisphaera salicampi]|uniref:Farnesyl diphosphate synthase n=1 Tax=Sedimentisphaera salicampi TaxID=1941349 RepID=A0A1W6LNW4_9BACT|nr:farnesyl diphosphate synthase [Sedimentisphaera salicampi]ARN57423.1 Farnesyl diphosphate synthase [Sedimentisphaera salicampi]OXU14440.1 Farnesyl diphosphate synthase [Sedimentisphaera salicampi]